LKQEELRMQLYCLW